jgi:hypothetical protein
MFLINKGKEIQNIANRVDNPRKTLMGKNSWKKDFTMEISSYNRNKEK